jgi:hypothetical protein
MKTNNVIHQTQTIVTPIVTVTLDTLVTLPQKAVKVFPKAIFLKLPIFINLFIIFLEECKYTPWGEWQVWECKCGGTRYRTRTSLLPSSICSQTTAFTYCDIYQFCSPQNEGGAVKAALLLATALSREFLEENFPNLTDARILYNNTGEPFLSQFYIY